MKRREFKTLALMGLASGLLLSNEASATQGKLQNLSAINNNSTKIAFQSSKSSNNNSNEDPNDSNLGYHMMTEDELQLELNDQGNKMYNSLSPQGKKLALQVASMRCAKTNPCAGLNACATDKNDCAGKGKCQGTGKCAVSDKNLAVKLVYQKMAKKRSNALNSNY